MQKENIGLTTIIADFMKAFNLREGLVGTIKDLFIRPEYVLNYYIDSKRGLKFDKKKYFFPGRLLVTMIAFVAIASFFLGDSVMVPQSLESSTGIFNYDDNSSKLLDFINQYMILIVFFSGIIPYALGTKLVFLKHRTYTFAIHLIMHIYLQSALLLLSPIFFLLTSTQEKYLAFFILTYTVYYTYAIKRIFNLSIVFSFFKTILFQLISLFIAVGIPVIIIALYAILKTLAN